MKRDYIDLEKGYAITDHNHLCHISFDTTTIKYNHSIIDILYESKTNVDEYSHSVYQMFLLMRNRFIAKFFSS